MTLDIMYYCKLTCHRDRIRSEYFFNSYIFDILSLNSNPLCTTVYLLYIYIYIFNRNQNLKFYSGAAY